MPIIVVVVLIISSLVTGKLIGDKVQQSSRPPITEETLSPTLWTPEPSETPQSTPQPTQEPQQQVQQAQTQGTTTIDCVGPDGKHLQVTQQQCQDFNNAWNPKSTSPTQENNFTNSNVVCVLSEGTYQMTRDQCNEMQAADHPYPTPNLQQYNIPPMPTFAPLYLPLGPLPTPYVAPLPTPPVPTSPPCYFPIVHPC